MGTFSVTIDVGDPEGQHWASVEALVDTGATYTMVEGSILRSLGLVPSFRFPFLLADGRQIERDMVETRIRLNGTQRTRIVVFGDDGTQPLLGAETLEGFGLAADPINRRLVPVPGLLMDVMPQG